jgi:hypothetical protein
MFSTRVAGFVIGCAVLSVGAQAAAATRQGHGVNAREQRQAQRIHQGVKSGEITPAEKDKLKADEAGVRADERVYRQSGDGLNKAERRDLEKDLNKTSREIYRAKHNDKEAK